MTTSFLYDGGSVLLEKQGGTTSATYTYGNALIRKDEETPLFDGLGSERTVTNSSQAVTASLTLSAFGQTVANSGSSTSAYQFGATSGYRMEGDVGLTLVGCRFYDAQVGRFITRDTYLDQKPYAYCDGDPVNGVDSSGHDPTNDPSHFWSTKLFKLAGVLGFGGTASGAWGNANQLPAASPVKVNGGRLALLGCAVLLMAIAQRWFEDQVPEKLTDADQNNLNWTGP